MAPRLGKPNPIDEAPGPAGSSAPHELLELIWADGPRRVGVCSPDRSALQNYGSITTTMKMSVTSTEQRPDEGCPSDPWDRLLRGGLWFEALVGAGRSVQRGPGGGWVAMHLLTGASTIPTASLPAALPRPTLETSPDPWSSSSSSSPRPSLPRRNVDTPSRLVRRLAPSLKPVECPLRYPASAARARAAEGGFPGYSRRLVRYAPASTRPVPTSEIAAIVSSRKITPSAIATTGRK
jgi:hypothetical protein